MALSFLYSDLLWAAPMEARSLLSRPATPSEITLRDPARFEAPSDFVNLKEIHKGDNGTFIIHIQDAHSNLSGQQNLANALDEIMTKYKVTLVLVEGGTKDDTLTPLKKIAPPEVWKKVAKSFLIEGRISGEEYLNLISDHPMKIMGIEDRDLYMASLRAYSDLAGKRQDILDYLKVIHRAVDKLKAKLYPSELLAYEKKIEDRRKKEENRGNGSYEIDFKELLDLIRHFESRQMTEREISKDEISRPVGPRDDILKNFPNLQKLAALQEKEKQIDFKLANLEQGALVEELAQKGGGMELQEYFKKISQMQNQKVSQYTFVENMLSLAKEKRMDVEKYSNLLLYREYLKDFSGLDFEALLDEMQKAEDQVYRNVIGSLPQAGEAISAPGHFDERSEEKSQKQDFSAVRPRNDTKAHDALLVRAIDRYLGLLFTAYQIQMSTKDFDLFKANEPDFGTLEYQAFINRKLAELGYFDDLVSYKNILEEGKASLESFYDSVTKRDFAFIQHTQQILKTENKEVAVLISGGYHTPHLKKLFKEKGYSYAVLAPIVTSETNQAKYERLLFAPMKRNEKAARGLEADLRAAEKQQNELRVMSAGETPEDIAALIESALGFLTQEERTKINAVAAKAALEVLRKTPIAARPEMETAIARSVKAPPLTERLRPAPTPVFQGARMAEGKEKPAKKSRFQFSLRTLLSAVFAIAVVQGVYFYYTDHSWMPTEKRIENSEHRQGWNVRHNPSGLTSEFMTNMSLRNRRVKEILINTYKYNESDIQYVSFYTPTERASDGSQRCFGTFYVAYMANEEIIIFDKELKWLEDPALTEKMVRYLGKKAVQKPSGVPKFEGAKGEERIQQVPAKTRTFKEASDFIDKFKTEHEGQLEKTPIKEVPDAPEKVIFVPQNGMGMADSPDKYAETGGCLTCLACILHSPEDRRSVVMHLDPKTNVEEALRRAIGKFSQKGNIEARLYGSSGLYLPTMARALDALSKDQRVSVKEVSTGDRPELVSPFGIDSIAANGEKELVSIKNKTPRVASRGEGIEFLLQEQEPPQPVTYEGESWDVITPTFGTDTLMVAQNFQGERYLWIVNKNEWTIYSPAGLTVQSRKMTPDEKKDFIKRGSSSNDAKVREIFKRVPSGARLAGSTGLPGDWKSNIPSIIEKWLKAREAGTERPPLREPAIISPITSAFRDTGRVIKKRAAESVKTVRAVRERVVKQRPLKAEKELVVTRKAPVSMPGAYKLPYKLPWVDKKLEKAIDTKWPELLKDKRLSDIRSRIKYFDDLFVYHEVADRGPKLNVKEILKDQRFDWNKFRLDMRDAGYKSLWTWADKKYAGVHTGFYESNNILTIHISGSGIALDSFVGGMNENPIRDAVSDFVEKNIKFFEKSLKENKKLFDKHIFGSDQKTAFQRYLVDRVLAELGVDFVFLGETMTTVKNPGAIKEIRPYTAGARMAVLDKSQIPSYQRIARNIYIAKNPALVTRIESLGPGYDFSIIAALFLKEINFMIDPEGAMKEMAKKYPGIKEIPTGEMQAISAFADLADVKFRNEAEIDLEAADFTDALGRMQAIYDIETGDREGNLNRTLPGKTTLKRPYLDLASGTNCIVYFRNLDKERSHIFVDSSSFVTAFIDEAAKQLAVTDRVTVRRMNLLNLVGDPVPEGGYGTIRLKNVWKYEPRIKENDSFWSWLKEAVAPGGEMVLEFRANNVVRNEFVPLWERYAKPLTGEWLYEANPGVEIAFGGEVIVSANDVLIFTKPSVLPAGARMAEAVSRRSIENAILILEMNQGFDVDEEQVKAAKLLGSLGPTASDKVVKVLIGAMKQGYDTPVRQAAATALGQIGPGALEAIPALTWASRKDGTLFTESRNALVQIVEQAKDAAVPKLIEALDGEYEVSDRASAAKALGWLGPDAKAAAPELLRILRDSQDEKTLSVVVETLNKIGPEALDEISPNVLNEIGLDAKNRNGRQMARDLMYGLLYYSGDSEIQRICAEGHALMVLPEKMNDIEWLIRVLRTTESDQVRDQYSKALVKQGPVAVAPLLEFFNPANGVPASPAAPIAFLNVLGDIGPTTEENARRLLPIIKNSDLAVRVSALWTLGKIAPDVNSFLIFVNSLDRWGASRNLYLPAFVQSQSKVMNKPLAPSAVALVMLDAIEAGEITPDRVNIEYLRNRITYYHNVEAEYKALPSIGLKLHLYRKEGIPAGTTKKAEDYLKGEFEFLSYLGVEYRSPRLMKEMEGLEIEVIIPPSFSYEVITNLLYQMMKNHLLDRTIYDIDTQITIEGNLTDEAKYISFAFLAASFNEPGYPKDVKTLMGPETSMVLAGGGVMEKLRGEALQSKERTDFLGLILPRFDPASTRSIHKFTDRELMGSPRVRTLNPSALFTVELIRSIQLLSYALFESLKKDTDRTKNREVAALFEQFKANVIAKATEFNIPTTAFSAVWLGKEGRGINVWEQLYPHLQALHNAKMDNRNVYLAFNELLRDTSEKIDDVRKAQRRRLPLAGARMATYAERRQSLIDMSKKGQQPLSFLYHGTTLYSLIGAKIARDKGAGGFLLVSRNDMAKLKIPVLTGEGAESGGDIGTVFVSVTMAYRVARAYSVLSSTEAFADALLASDTVEDMIKYYEAKKTKIQEELRTVSEYSPAGKQLTISLWDIDSKIAVLRANRDLDIPRLKKLVQIPIVYGVSHEALKQIRESQYPVLTENAVKYLDLKDVTHLYVRERDIPTVKEILTEFGLGDIPIIPLETMDVLFFSKDTEIKAIGADWIEKLNASGRVKELGLRDFGLSMSLKGEFMDETKTIYGSTAPTTRGLYQQIREEVERSRAERPEEEKNRREELNRLVSWSDPTAAYSPEAVITFIKEKLGYRETYGKDVGVSEGFTLEEHTLPVMNNFENFGFSKSLPKIEGLNVAPLVRLALAFHDIGKPEAVEQGNKGLQHAFTAQIIKKEMARLGYTDREINFVLGLVSGDPIGKLLQGGLTADEAYDEISQMADRAGMDIKKEWQGRFWRWEKYTPQS